MISLNEQITAAQDYAESIVTTIREPLLVLDKNLRVMRANSAFYDVFKFHKQEMEGCKIYDMGNKQWNIPELQKLLEDVLPFKAKVTNYEVAHCFPTLGSG